MAEMGLEFANACKMPLIYIEHEEYDNCICLSRNPSNATTRMREQYQFVVPRYGNRWVDNVICLMNCSTDGSIYGNAAISFMDPSFVERCAIGYSRNKLLQPGGYVANTLYLEIGNAFDTEVESRTDFRVICTLKGINGYFFPLEILCNGEINMNLRWEKNLNVSGGAIQANDGLILKSPNGTRYKLVVDNSGNLSTITI